METAKAAIDRPTRSPRLGLLTSWSSRAGGGVFEAVVALAHALKDDGRYLPIVLAPEDRFTAEDKDRLGDIELRTVPRFGPGGFSYAPGLFDRIIAADIDVLHLHGIWQYASLCGARWAERTQRPYVISPHGMLDPWITSRGRWKKALARRGYEHRSWRRAALFHALTSAEAADIARAVSSAVADPRIEIVPNPIPVGPQPPTRTPSQSILYIGRIHPKKNLMNLVDAWTAAGMGKAGYRLDLYGWGDKAHVEVLEEKLRDGADTSATFHGPVYGEAKEKLLSEARFLILPSLSEGLPMAILEAWAVGTPCLMSAACNLSEGFARGAAIETGMESSAIVHALRAGMEKSEAQWREMSRAAYHLARERFSPPVIAAQWSAIYDSLL